MPPCGIEGWTLLVLSLNTLFPYRYLGGSRMWGFRKKEKKKDRSLERKIRNDFYDNLVNVPLEERMM